MSSLQKLPSPHSCPSWAHPSASVTLGMGVALVLRGREMPRASGAESLGGSHSTGAPIKDLTSPWKQQHTLNACGRPRVKLRLTQLSLNVHSKGHLKEQENNLSKCFSFLNVFFLLLKQIYQGWSRVCSTKQWEINHWYLVLNSWFFFFFWECLETVVINTNKCKAAFKMTFCYRHIPELFICVKCILPWIICHVARKELFPCQLICNMGEKKSKLLTSARCQYWYKPLAMKNTELQEGLPNRHYI